MFIFRNPFSMNPYHIHFSKIFKRIIEKLACIFLGICNHSTVKIKAIMIKHIVIKYNALIGSTLIILKKIIFALTGTFLSWKIRDPIQEVFSKSLLVYVINPF